MECFNSVSAPADISKFVTGQNVSVKVYPPPKAEFKAPELPSPKQPDAPPINLVSFHYCVSVITICDTTCTIVCVNAELSVVVDANGRICTYERMFLLFAL